MPLYDFQCKACGKESEVLVIDRSDLPTCSHCGSQNLKKLMAAHSSMSGPSKNSMPGLKDTACCGSTPGQASGCAGPGSCCGKSF
ncbi:FmdB family zinc ribbon protein [Desulfospira joergensenii]|uniref:FmdB family zinc ribbon protein n=1 Tax=Desulfospira joergensenii TaxID=53329 RepID=UPI0003B6F3C7|nr:zinc ribbon domain-containing protein [Desulfospira joergensenii]